MGLQRIKTYISPIICKKTYVNLIFLLIDTFPLTINNIKKINKTMVL